MVHLLVKFRTTPNSLNLCDNKSKLNAEGTKKDILVNDQKENRHLLAKSERKPENPIQKTNVAVTLIHRPLKLSFPPIQIAHVGWLWFRYARCTHRVYFKFSNLDCASLAVPS
ncbi:hypothetical protein PM082_004600 [Marasmius tenuissimus]|nr:hypothetical protein PM082_004600 [Marasmius tenuissimus]